MSGDIDVKAFDVDRFAKFRTENNKHVYLLPVDVEIFATAGDWLEIYTDKQTFRIYGTLQGFEDEMNRALKASQEAVKILMDRELSKRGYVLGKDVFNHEPN